MPYPDRTVLKQYGAEKPVGRFVLAMVMVAIATASWLSVGGAFAQSGPAGSASKPVSTKSLPAKGVPPAPMQIPAAVPAAPSLPDLPRAAFLAQMDAEYRRRDADGDGKVTRAEMERWEHNEVLAKAQAANRAQFLQLDADRNGVLSPGEFAALVRDPGIPDITSLMQRFDPNRDQVVMLVEWRAGTLANFDRLDTDHDGVVTSAEATAPSPLSRPGGR